MFGRKKKKKNTKDVDAFNSKTSGNGKVNDPSDNFLLNRVRKNQLNPRNKSQSSTFQKRQQRLKDLLKKQGMD
tara:strand:+ start:2338 stop:2556 length:219 start_codon:yes stop_codon:yes gene_type:complete